jgi:hypothetical protein
MVTVEADGFRRETFGKDVSEAWGQVRGELVNLARAFR